MVDEESQGTGASGGGQALAGVGARINRAQVALTAKALPPDGRETVMHGLATGLDQLKGLIEAVLATDMRLNLGSVATVVQGEPQIRAISEQTDTRIAGPSAISRHTMEGRTYLAWQGAAASLLRTVENRDDMVAAALRADLASEAYRAPEQPVPVAQEQPVAKPDIDAYRYQEAPVLLTGLTAISMVWLLVEVVLGVFGAEGLLNSWAVLGITVTLAWLGKVLATERIRPQYESDTLQYAAYLERCDRVDDANRESRAGYQAEREAWARRVQLGVGIAPDGPSFDWIKDPAQREALTSVRQMLEQDRKTVPSPEMLPVLALPDAKETAGADPDTQLDQLLRAFTMALEGSAAA